MLVRMANAAKSQLVWMEQERQDGKWESSDDFHLKKNTVELALLEVETRLKQLTH